MKPDVTDVDSGSQWHAEGLNGAIQVLVIKSVLIVPNASSRVGHLVTHEPDAIVARIRLDLIYCRARPAQALMAGCIRTVRAERRKRETVVPVTENWR